MPHYTFAPLALCLTSLLFNASIKTAQAEAGSILIQSTTSTANSGLYDHILPHFTDETGIDVHVVAVGTGQAIRNAQNCDGDVLLVHAKSAEEEFVRAGYGLERHDLMYNDFVIVGPSDDPSGIANSGTITEVLSKLAASQSLFASRGDDSGTHKKEQSLWALAEVDPAEASGRWYRETGAGMGATLNIAVGMGAYTMTDRATWISFNNKQDFAIHYEDDPALFNQYGIIVVNPEHCTDSQTAQASRFSDWMLSAQGQSHIADYQLAGEQLFFPNADAPDHEASKDNQ